MSSNPSLSGLLLFNKHGINFDKQRGLVLRCKFAAKFCYLKQTFNATNIEFNQRQKRFLLVSRKEKKNV